MTTGTCRVRRTARRFVLCGAVAPLILTGTAGAQARVISGRVVDTLGVPVPDARIEVVGTFQSAVSAANGSFRITTSGDTAAIDVRRLGFRPLRVLASTAPDSTIVVMHRDPAVLLGIVVPGEREVALAQTVTRATVRQVPPLGEPDIMRVLPFLSGVSQPNDMLGRVHLAGAAGDETLITLDDHPIQAPSHLVGIIGAFNVAALERAEVRVHHVPATSDTRLGGVIAMATRAVTQQHEGEAVLSLLSTSATVSHPLRIVPAELLASARITYIDKVLGRLSDDAARDPASLPTYGDALARVGTNLGAWRLEALGWTTWDARRPGVQSGAEALNVQEVLAGFTLSRADDAWRTRLRVSTDRATAHDRTLIADREALLIDQQWSSVALSVGRKFGHAVVADVTVGGDMREHTHQWSNAISLANPSLPNRFDGRTDLTRGFVATDVHFGITQGVTAGAGLRATRAGRHASVAPQAMVEWRLRPNLLMQVSADRRHQFDGQYGEPEEGSVMQPLVLYASPSAASTLASSVDWSMGTTRRLSLNLAAFGRSFSNRPAPREMPRDTITYGTLEVRRVNGRAAGVGGSVTLSVPSGFVWQSSYALTRSFERPDGRWRSTIWDIPHTLTSFVNVPVTRRWAATVALQLHSGVPATPVLTRILVPSPVFPDVLVPRNVYGAPNSARLPAFRRLDLAVRRMWQWRGLEMTATLQAINAWARTNVLAYDWNSFLSSRRGEEAARRSGLPFVPSIGLEILW